MKATCADVKIYREEHDCSLHDAKMAVTRLMFGKEIKLCKSMEEIKNVMIEIFDFEYGGYK